MPKDPDHGADAEKIRKEEQRKIDEAEPLTDEEIAIKEDLLKQVDILMFVFTPIHFR